MNKNGYRNGVLTVIALLLGVLVISDGPSEAGAQITHAGEQITNARSRARPPAGGGLVSAADQRKQIMREMQSMRKQLEQINSTLRGGLNVKVTEMPEIHFPERGDG